MIGILLLSHGRLADELLTSARTISGPLDGFEAVSLDWTDGYEEARVKIDHALERVDTGDGVLVLIDMFGGTPCNVALTFSDPGRIEIVTGANLPMVVRLACQGRRERPVAEVARWLQDKAVRSICLASELESGARRAPEPPCEESAGNEAAVAVGSEGGG